MSDKVDWIDTPEYQRANDSQKAAADPAGSAWVAANAGSGKTKVLIDRVARLLLKGAAPASILCVTYTKAAANEMLDRLFDRLGSWSVMDESKLRTELRQLEGGTREYDDAALKQARALFARALETPGGLRIETIHAFCSRILRRFPLEAGVAPGFRELEDTEAGELWDMAAGNAIMAADQNAPDALAVVSLAGGAGGAAQGITALKSASALALDFAAKHGTDADRTDAIRGALSAPDAEAADYLAGQMADVPWETLTTILPILHESGKKSDLILSGAIEEALMCETPEDKWAAYAEGFLTQTRSLRKTIYNKDAGNTPEIVDLFSPGVPEGSEVTRVLAIEAALKALTAAETTCALFTVGLPALTAYQRFKRDRAALDFDDLILKTRDLMTRSGMSPWVLYKLDGGLTHVLLDEAQDTAPDQWTLLNALTGEFFAGHGIERKEDPRTLFVVGDEKQSIYSFQGADPDRFIDERQHFVDKAAAAEIPHQAPEMAMSFRSSPDILGFVDSVFNTASADGPAFTVTPPQDADIVRHTARREGQPGLVELWPIDEPAIEEEPDHWTPLSELSEVDALSKSSPKAQLAKSIAANVKAMIDNGETVWERDGKGAWRRPITAGDILIIVRKRTGGLFDAIIAELKSLQLPVAGADRLVLTDHIGVQDLLNLIRFCLLPEDDLTLAEIMRGPFLDLVDDGAHLYPLAHDRGEASLWERLQGSAEPEHKVAAVWLAELQARAHLPPYEFLTAALTERSSDGISGWDRLTARLGGPVRDPVEALLSRALAHDAKGAASLQTFVSALDTDTAEIKRDLDAPDGEVRVMTVHGAKGLQAPVVILPDTTSKPGAGSESFFLLDGAPVRAGKKEQDTPAMAAAREMADKKALYEHRRLLYVALTRAEDRLIIYGHWTGTRPKDGQKKIPTGRDPGCWYELCEDGLEALEVSVPEDGTPARYGTAPITMPPAVDGDSAKPAAPAWLKTSAAQEASIRRYAAPTSLAPGDAPVIPPFGANYEDRLKRGRMIHALLQRLPDLPPETREAAGANFLALDSDLTADQRSDMLSAAMKTLTHPGFEGVFAPGGRAEAPVIGTASELPDGVILNGRVDRLVVTDDEILIIDFKTDRPPPADPSGVGAQYLLQMAAYRAVLQEAYQGRPVRCALLWTDGPSLMELPENLLLEALKGLKSPLDPRAESLSV